MRLAGTGFDFRGHFCHSTPMEMRALGFRLRANAPEGQKRLPISTRSKQKTRTLGEPVAEGPSPAEKAREAAASTSKTLRAAPDNDMLLALYSLYKHGQHGRCDGRPPPRWLLPPTHLTRDFLYCRAVPGIWLQSHHPRLFCSIPQIRAWKYGHPLNLQSAPKRPFCERISNVIPFDKSSGCDLILDATYEGGIRGNTDDDPINRLVAGGNQGGF